MNNLTDTAALACRTARLSKRLTVEITLGKSQMTVEWSPDVPTYLTHKERRAYRAVRDEVVNEAAQKLGAGILIAET